VCPIAAQLQTFASVLCLAIVSPFSRSASLLFFFPFSLFVSARQSIMPFSKTSFNFFFDRLFDARVNKKETNVQGSIALVCVNVCIL
jgi:hypothetical protein